MNNLPLLLSLTFSFFVVTSSFGQDSLQVKYDKLIDKTETFKQFKLIPKTDLDGFWSEAVDSLKNANERINDLKGKVTAQEDSIQSLKGKVNTAETSLNDSLEMNDSISFLGIDFTKLAYHIIVWTIIIALVVGTAIAYMMFLRSNMQTTKFKRELDRLTTELENHKDKAREQQMKLKRELQTAMNSLNERR